VEKADPMPQFTWFIDDEVLENTKTFPEALGQTLELELNANNVNKTLKCEVLFKDIKTVMETTEVLDFQQRDSASPVVVLQGYIFDVWGILAIIGAVFFSVALVFVCYKCNCLCFKKTNDGVDAEKGEKVETDTEKVDLTKEERGEDEVSEEQTEKPSMKSRFVSFFRVNKGFTSDEPQENEETKENGEVKIDMIDDKTDLEKETAEEKDEKNETAEESEMKIDEKVYVQNVKYCMKC